METFYYTTTSYIRHQGNVVDLNSYRRRLAAVSGENWVAEPVAEPTAPITELYVMTQPAVRSRAARRRHRRAGRLALYLDLCASLVVVALTLTAVVQFVRLG